MNDCLCEVRERALGEVGPGPGPQRVEARIVGHDARPESGGQHLVQARAEEAHAADVDRVHRAQVFGDQAGVGLAERNEDQPPNFDHRLPLHGEWAAGDRPPPCG